MVFFDFIGSFREAIFGSLQYISFYSINHKIKAISSTTLKNAGTNMPLLMYDEFTLIVI